MLYSIVVVSDHFQVLIADATYGPRIDTTHLWDSSTGVASVAESPQLIAIPTVRYGGRTNVEVELLLAPPSTAYLGDWQQIGTFAIDVASGKLLLWGPEATDFESLPHISVEAGFYQGIAYSYGTAYIEDEMRTEGQDKYRISMWRAHRHDNTGTPARK